MSGTIMGIGATRGGFLTMRRTRAYRRLVPRELVPQRSLSQGGKYSSCMPKSHIEKLGRCMCQGNY